ncbi:protein Turandot X [Drosophila teissieri]|uniref:protein Turandot X n=1 Tax=Drosophila teissieri TaxID=7243 RepID=UPI001CB9F8ED|nr:protein Turandot X [Drosophila teissieri]
MWFYISSLLICVLLGIVRFASAGTYSSSYEAHRNSLLNIFHNPFVNDSIKERNIPELIAFYHRYPTDVPLSDADRQQFERFIHDYRDYRRVLIDGVPPQGGTFGNVFGHFLGRVGTRYISSLFNKKREEGQSTHAKNSTTPPSRIQDITK